MKDLFWEKFFFLPWGLACQNLCWFDLISKWKLQFDLLASGVYVVLPRPPAHHETQIVSLLSQNLKTFEYSKKYWTFSKLKLICHAKAQHVGHLKVAEGQKIECFQTNWISMPRHSMLNIQYYLNILKNKICWTFNERVNIEPHQRPFCVALPKWFRGIFLIWN